MRTALFALSASLPLLAQAEPPAAPTITAFVDGMRHLPGFVELFLDEAKGAVFARLVEFDRELLYVTAHASGLGSNPIGLDRGSLGPQRVVTFHRAGPKVLVLARNLRFRARSDDVRERLAVAESFAPSAIAALPIVAEQDGAVLVDATKFFLRDATGAARRLGDGYSVDAERSALWPERTRAFPDNTEVEVLLTFAANKPNREVAAVADGRQVTLRQHHSLIRLPDDGYRPRRADPRVGYFGPSFQDYAAPLGASMHVRYIARHRLRKRDPDAPVSEPVEPIVYYVDPGTPEPVRSALIEGSMWWNEAFLAAGFRDAFRVELLPEDADPMDVRYNMIHWVHRQTRGWSYGASITDPRTGEILKGNVLLGSLRVRQDLLKFVGLQAPFDRGACMAAASPGADHLLFGDDEQAQRVALMRIRQLAAHEVGHTLGLSHNFAASSYGRASVMDYPAPLVAIDGEQLDFSAAYATGIGAYDTWAIAYGYTQFAPDVDEAVALDELVRVGLQNGYVFLTDQDARAAGSAHPLAALWDNGADAVRQLEQEIRVRAIALRRFGVDALRPGASLAELEDTLVPLYLHHRFQLEAALRLIGGVDFRHALKGDGQTPTTPVPVERQEQALRVVLGTLTDEFLRLDPRLLARIPPPAPGHPATAERFPRSTGALLDPVAMAAVSARLTIDGLLQRERAARLEHRGDGRGLTFDGVLQALADQVLARPLAAGGMTSLERAVQDVLVDRVIALADDAAAAAAVRAAAEEHARHLRRIAMASAAESSLAAVDRQHLRAMAARLAAFLERRDRTPQRVPALSTPPGSPIGGGRTDR